jgi:hypothetical protein
VRDAVTEGLDKADALVARDERRTRLDRPVSASAVDVGVAQPGGLDLDTDLAGAGLGVGALLDDQGLTEGSYDCCLHGFSPPRGRSAVCDDGDGCGGVVQYGVRDRADAGAERAPPDAATHDDRGGLAGGVDQVNGGRSVPRLLDDLDGGEPLPPRAKDVAQGGGLLPGQLTSFSGRPRDLASLAALPHSRLRTSGGTPTASAQLSGEPSKPTVTLRGMVSTS